MEDTKKEIELLKSTDGKNGKIKVVCKLANTVFRPVATEGLHFYLSWSLLMRIFKKNYWSSSISMETTNKIFFLLLNRVVHFVFFFLLCNSLVYLKFIKNNFLEENSFLFQKQIFINFIDKIIAWKRN